jgi:hypothetical protein
MDSVTFTLTQVGPDASLDPLAGDTYTHVTDRKEEYVSKKLQRGLIAVRTQKRLR